jgi:hypothetical protein
MQSFSSELSMRARSNKQKTTTKLRLSGQVAPHFKKMAEQYKDKAVFAKVRYLCFFTTLCRLRRS